MKISKMLERKGTFVATIDPGVLVSGAVDALASHNVGALVVSSDGRSIEGIVSERDIVRVISAQGAAALAAKVSDVMSDVVVTCSPDDAIDSLMVTMTERRIRHMPVVKDGALAGIVSIGDIVKNRIDELEGDTKALVDYINAR